MSFGLEGFGDFLYAEINFTKKSKTTPVQLFCISIRVFEWVDGGRGSVYASQALNRQKKVVVHILNLFIGSTTGAIPILGPTSTWCQTKGYLPEDVSLTPSAPQPVPSSSNSPAKKESDLAVPQQEIPTDMNFPSNAGALL